MVTYLLLPALIVPHSWSSTFLANTIYALGITHYFYSTFVGFSSVPFLKSTNLLLWPVIGVCVVIILLTVIAKFNVVIFVMNLRYAP